MFTFNQSEYLAAQLQRWIFAGSLVTITHLYFPALDIGQSCWSVAGYFILRVAATDHLVILKKHIHTPLNHQNRTSWKDHFCYSRGSLGCWSPFFFNTRQDLQEQIWPRPETDFFFPWIRL